MIDTLTYHHIKNKSPKDLFEMRAELHHIDLLSQPETQVTISSPDNIIIIYNIHRLFKDYGIATLTLNLLLF